LGHVNSFGFLARGGLFARAVLSNGVEAFRGSGWRPLSRGVCGWAFGRSGGHANDRGSL